MPAAVVELQPRFVFDLALVMAMILDTWVLLAIMAASVPCLTLVVLDSCRRCNMQLDPDANSLGIKYQCHGAFLPLAIFGSVYLHMFPSCHGHRAPLLKSWRRMQLVAVLVVESDLHSTTTPIAAAIGLREFVRDCSCVVLRCKQKPRILMFRLSTPRLFGFCGSSASAGLRELHGYCGPCRR